MEYEKLSRRELQGLCKKNKIPANLTNLAMAHALSALPSVEGLEEFLNPEQSHIDSPEKTAVKETVPRTSCRTSTRRKDEPQSSQILTRTRLRSTRRAVASEQGDDAKPEASVGSVCRKMENQLKEAAAAEDEKKGSETPAIMSHRRAGASVKQQVYSTRRTTRLLEKQMMEMNLDDGTKDVKGDAVDEELVKDLRNDEGSADLGKVLEVEGLNQQHMPIEEEAISAYVSDEKPTLLVECGVEQHMEVDNLKVEQEQRPRANNGSDTALVLNEEMGSLNQVYKDAGDEVYEETKGHHDSGLNGIDSATECLVLDIEEDLSLNGEFEGHCDQMEVNQEEYAVEGVGVTFTGEEKSEGKDLNNDGEVQDATLSESLIPLNQLGNEEVATFDESKSDQMVTNLCNNNQTQSEGLDNKSDHISSAASLIEINKSEIKSPKTIQELAETNKENFGNTIKKLEYAKNDMGDDATENLNDKSLRQLRKMIKALTITNENDISEEDVAAKVGRARPALQPLSDS